MRKSRIGSRIAAKACHFLKDGLALLGHRIGCLYRLAHLGVVVPQAQHVSRDQLATPAQRAAGAGIIIAAFTNVAALRLLHLAL